ncbi:Calpain-type cysteine protease DEK1 [Lecanosticta acicola]|uniref:Calpain-type cysteine protease DEK1 n=1 Tax=Lecanosticta acicola TaxID=111012 RepID=A0AAI8Z8M6_9PEZI|nr:Calpain-type cysteine protease DEK1 [Lecanosticta acicola]
MKSRFVRVSAPEADPEPPPEPIPFPIKIVAEPVPSPAPAAASDLPASSAAKPVDGFYRAWEKFLAVEPERAKATCRAARKVEQEREQVGRTPGDGLQIEENAARSWQQAAEECRAKVKAIVDECQRLNQKYRDAIFDLEANEYCLQALGGRYPKAVDNIDAPPWIKRVEDIFDDPQFFIDGASATDVHQGSGGDCWFLASLMAVSAKKELIEQLCVARDEKVGVYGFVFFRDGEWVHEVIDDKLFLRVGDDDELDVVRGWDRDEKDGLALKYDEDKLKDALQRGGTALYFSHCKSNETWLPLIEKAYAKAHGDYFAIEGGFASEGIEDLTGGVAVVINPEDIMDKDRFWKEQLSQVNEKYLFGGGSRQNGSKGFVGGHAYAVLEAWEEGGLKLLKLRNPWGETEWEGDWSDGSKLWTADMMTKLKHTFGDDGVFWISFADFLKHFPSINRVRLFDENWKVGQQWTCVSVPWTVDYLDTKFQFTISEQGPVVLVLAQPDDRYFYGLRGRYLFSMHFRVYRQGEESRWIVRSMHNSGNETVFTRSVSAEIEDLEPGTYDVVFKVTAIRSNSSLTAEEAVLKYATDRKEKLLHVGRRFDYAHTKGDLRGMEQKVKEQKRRKRKDKEKSMWKKERKLRQREKERARKRKQRVDNAMREQRKGFEKKQREKMRARKGRAAATGETESVDAQAGGTETENSDKGVSVTPLSSTEEPVKVHEQMADGDTDGSSKTEIREADTGIGAEQAKDKTEDLSKQLSRLDIQPSQSDRANPSRPSPLVEEEDDEDDYDSPIEPPEELSDNDFDWDSEM